MRTILFLGLIGLALVAANSHREPISSWQQGSEYVFEYSGHIISTIPDLNSKHVSGVAIRANVSIAVASATSFHLTVDKAEYANMNGELIQGVESIPKANYAPVPPSWARYLKSGASFEVDEGTGLFRDMTVSEGEPEWVINFKKALIAIFQTSHRPGSGSEVWTEEEQALDGACQVSYQRNEVPNFMVDKIKPYLSEQSLQACGQQPHFVEVTKVRDLDDCSRRAIYGFQKPGRFDCPESGNCQGRLARASSTKYISCEINGKLEVQSAINSGELVLNILAFKSENSVTSTEQVLKLVSTRRISSPHGAHSKPLTLRSLLYSYKISGDEQDSDNEVGDRTRRWSGISKKLINQMSLSHPDANGIDTHRIQDRIIDLVLDIVRKDLYAPDLAKQQTTMKAINIAKGLSLLTKEQINALWSSLKGHISHGEEQQTLRHVFFDCLLMGGSEANILFLKDAILAGEISSLKISTIFMSMTRHVTTPNEKVLEALLEVIRSSKITRNTMVWSHAVMGFSTLVNRACIAEDRAIAYPVNVFGQFCSPKSPVIVQELIPYLQSELKHTSEHESAKRNIILTALGQLAHENVIPILIPYIEGSAPNSSEMSRFLSLYALANMGSKHSELVAPVFLAIFNNRGESTQLRATAFNSILKIDPSMAVLQQIVDSTWTEPDREILNLVNSAFATISRQSKIITRPPQTLNLIRRSAILYPLMKSTEGTFPSTATLFNAQFLPDLDVGYESISSWTASNSSSMPQNAYYRLSYILNRYTLAPIEIGVQQNGVGSLVNEIINLISEKNNGGKSNFDLIKDSVPAGAKEILEKLKAKENTEKAEASVWLNILEDSPMLYSYDISAEKLKGKVASLMENPKKLQKYLNGEQTINYQNFMNLNPMDFMIPSDMGFPMLAELNAPAAINIKGKFESNSANWMPYVNASFQATFATQYIGFVGTFSPFTHEYIATGIDEQAVINIPLNFDLKINPLKHSVELSAIPAPGLRDSFNMVHLHVKPFTVSENSSDLVPLTLSPNMKLIKSPQETKQYKAAFGKSVGFNLEADVQTQSAFNDPASFLQRAGWFRYCPFNLAIFPAIPTSMSETHKPSARFSQMVLSYNPSKSATTRITFTAKIGRSSKTTHGGTKDHIVEVSDKTNGLPFKVVSKEENKIGYATKSHQKLIKLLKKDNINDEDILYTDEADIYTKLSFIGGPNPLNVTTDFTFAKAETKDSQSILYFGVENEDKLLFHIYNTNSMSIRPSASVDIEKLRSAVFEGTCYTRFDFDFTGKRRYHDNVVEITTKAKATGAQKEYSRTSPEAKQLKQMLEKNVPLAELSAVADQVRAQASSLNQFNTKIKYTNVPEWFIKVRKMALTIFKGNYWPYLEDIGAQEPHKVTRGQGEDHIYEDEVDILVNPSRQTFNANITIPQISESAVARDGPLPFPFNIIPFAPGPVKPFRAHVSDAIIGSNTNTCKLDGSTIITFDNRTIKNSIDECFTTLATDCKTFKFTAFVRESKKIPSQPRQQLLVAISNVVAFIDPPKAANETCKANVNGEDREVLPDMDEWVIYTRDKSVMSITVSGDGTVVTKILGVVTFTIAFDKLVVNPDPSLKGDLCGLCGNYNGQAKDDLTGPTCAYNTDDLLIASYRVKAMDHAEDQECAPLPHELRQRLQRANEKCEKVKVIPTKVSAIASEQLGACTRHEHTLIERDGQLCISRRPVVVCGPACKPATAANARAPSSNGLVSKRVSYTCMKRDRVGQLYAEKARQGKVITELAIQPEAFSLDMELPRMCKPVAPLN